MQSQAFTSKYCSGRSLVGFLEMGLDGAAVDACWRGADIGFVHPDTLTTILHVTAKYNCSKTAKYILGLLVILHIVVYRVR